MKDSTVRVITASFWVLLLVSLLVALYCHNRSVAPQPALPFTVVGQIVDIKPFDRFGDGLFLMRVDAGYYRYNVQIHAVGLAGYFNKDGTVAGKQTVWQFQSVTHVDDLLWHNVRVEGVLIDPGHVTAKFVKELL